MITRKRDDFHWTNSKLLSYNKTFNFAVSGRGPGKTTDTLRYMMSLHKKGYMIIMIKRNIVDITDTTLSDFENAYNILVDENDKISLYYKKGDMGKGIVDIYIDGETEPFFRLIALSNPKYRLKGMAFDREIALIVFDEYKISGSEKYLKDEYGKFTELYATLCRFGIALEDGSIKPPRVLFLGNNYSLSDPYIANMQIPIAQIKPGIVITGETWAFEDIKINDRLREYLLQQNPLFKFGDDAYNKYALEGISVADQRIQTVDKPPDKFKLVYVFHIENRYLGVYYNNDGIDDYDKLWYWCEVLPNYNSKRRDAICFDYMSLVDGSCLLSSIDKARLASLAHAFRNRKIAYKTIYEGYLFEQIYDNI